MTLAPRRRTARSVNPSLSTSSGYAPVTAVRSVTDDGSGSKRSAPPTSLLVPVEGGRLGATGEVQVGQPVVVAVEGGDATADEVLVGAFVRMVDARAGRVVDEPRRVAVVGRGR